jgi:hypothetical protein
MNTTTLATDVRTLLAEKGTNRQRWAAAVTDYLQGTDDYWAEQVQRARRARLGRDLIRADARLRDRDHQPSPAHEWVDGYEPLEDGGVENVSGWIVHGPAPADPEESAAADFAWLAALHDTHCTRGGRGIGAVPLVDVEALPSGLASHWARLLSAVQHPRDSVALCGRLAEALVRVRGNLAPKLTRRKRGKRPPRAKPEPRPTDLEVLTMAVLARHAGNVSAAAAELGRDRKTVEENRDRAMRKLAKIEGAKSRSVRARAMPEDHRGQVNVADD